MCESWPLIKIYRKMLGREKAERNNEKNGRARVGRQREEN